ncbi:MAG: hypothetical protein NZ742_02810 [Acidobacteria bacterium]|nr:hypothetical protein [Acidobacteriota bacterium]MDW7983809.1 hypothetical protein [Acidobacteriota bacterium]
MRDLRREIRRSPWWAWVGALLFLGIWGVHAHPGNMDQCSLCAQSLIESRPPVELDVLLVSHPLTSLDIWVLVLRDQIPLFSSRAPPAG